MQDVNGRSIKRQQLQLLGEQLQPRGRHSLPEMSGIATGVTATNCGLGGIWMGVEIAARRQVPRHWCWPSRGMAGSQSAEVSEAGVESAVADLIQS